MSALSYNGFRVITLSRWGSGVFQLFFSGDTFFTDRYSLGAIHDAGITQWTKDYIDNPYGIQRIWFNIKNGYQKGDKHHYKEFLKNKNKAHIDENMKKQTIKLNESQLRGLIKESIKKVLREADEEIQEGKFGRALAGLGLAATLATTPSCSYFNNEPNPGHGGGITDYHWSHEGPYSAQEKQDKTWNTHNEKGDWNNIEEGVGFIYNCKSRCRGGWNVGVIFADKTTGWFILPQECKEYLFGRYMPNCNCFENENTTDRINTNGLQKLDGNNNDNGDENTIYLGEKTNKNMKKNTLIREFRQVPNRFNESKKTVKLNESQLRELIREALSEVAGYGATMQNAGNAFDQNTFMGRVRSALNPRKAQQFQRIQQNANQIGQKAARDVNAAREQIPNWDTTGQNAYNQRTTQSQAAINKYGTGGMVLKPSMAYATGKYSDHMDNDLNQQVQAYNAQQQQMQQQSYPVNETRLNSIIKESIKKILDESRYADAIADRMFAQLQRETNPVKKRQLQQELISMGYLQAPTKQPQQQTQQSGNIYSQIRDALNTNNQAFFRGINGNTLKTAVDTMYNQGKITDNERNKCYQWIGQGFRYSQSPGNYNW